MFWHYSPATRVEEADPDKQCHEPAPSGRPISTLVNEAGGDKGFHHAKIPVLDAGDEHEVSYHVTFNDESKGVNANLTVVQVDDQAALLEVSEAEMIIDWP